MIHAVFTAEGRPLAQFDDDLTTVDSRILAESALLTTYQRTAGAYVDALCVEHDGEPKGSCTGCETKAACPDCTDGRPCLGTSH